jgi:DNA-binding transcriptional MerR regulator
MRYGWPIPTRSESGYRQYDHQTVENIKRVAAIHAVGVPLIDLIKDGKTYFPTVLAQKPKKPRYKFDMVPLPTNPQAQRIRAELEQAIKDGREGKIQEILAQKDLLRPSERHCAILDVLRAAGR